MSAKNNEEVLKSSEVRKELADAISKMSGGDGTEPAKTESTEKRESLSPHCEEEAVGKEGTPKTETPNNLVSALAHKNEETHSEPGMYTFEDYEDDYFRLRSQPVPFTMSLTIPQPIHKELKKILFYFAPRIPLNAFVSNILLRHIEDNKEMLSEELKKRFEQNGMMF